MSAAVQLLVGTRKGAWIYRSDAARRAWSVQGPIFLGHIVNHLVLDPRDGKTLLMAASTGHLGPTIFRSADGALAAYHLCMADIRKMLRPKKEAGAS